MAAIFDGVDIDKISPGELGLLFLRYAGFLESALLSQNQEAYGHYETTLRMIMAEMRLRMVKLQV